MKGSKNCVENFSDKKRGTLFSGVNLLRYGLLTPIFACFKPKSLQYSAASLPFSRKSQTIRVNFSVQNFLPYFSYPNFSILNFDDKFSYPIFLTKFSSRRKNEKRRTEKIDSPIRLWNFVVVSWIRMPYLQPSRREFWNYSTPDWTRPSSDWSERRCRCATSCHR